jgi:hypothetical protein
MIVWTRGTRFIGGDWKMFPGALIETVDDYGQDTFERRKWLVTPNGKFIQFDGDLGCIAGAMYRRITGVDYSGPESGNVLDEAY